MPHPDAFLATIRERPEDDGPRLIYADWLEEHGDPRGEFIRVQCELANQSPWDPRRAALEEREADLLAAHDHDWLGRPPRWLIDWGFKRGFVEHFAVTQPTLAGLEGLLAQSIQPAAAFVVRHPQQLSGASLNELRESPDLEQLGGLDWWEPVPREEFTDLISLLSSPRLSGLRRLSVRGEAAQDGMVPLLDQRTGSANLRDLALERLSPLGAECFQQCHSLSNIGELTFYREVAAAFLRGLGQTPARWRRLDLGSSAFRAADLATLADCECLRELRITWGSELESPLPLPRGLKQLHINCDTALPLPAALPRLDALPALEWLHVRMDAAEPPEARDDAAHLGEILQRLAGPVFHCEAVSHHLTLGHLARLPARDRFRRLVFDCDDATDADVRALVESAGFDGLQSFHLHCPRLTPRHLAMLADMPFPPSLRRLSINSTLADDAGVARLLRSPYLQRLTLINLRECHVGYRTLAALAESPGLARLRDLILPAGGELDEADRRQFRATPGLSPLFRLGVG